MLGKLLKYEFKSFSRLLGVIYIAVLAVAVVTGLLLRGSIWSESVASGNETALIIFVIAYVIVVLALILITILMNIERFYNSMLGGEGYLTHTLPVPTWMHICAKTISAFIYTILSGVVLVVSALLILVCSNLGDILSYGVSRVLAEFSSFFWEDGAAIVLCVIAVLLGLVRLILIFYTSMAIGGSARKNKIFLSIVAFIVIVIIVNVISSLTSQGFLNEILSESYFYNYSASATTDLLYDTEYTGSSLLGNTYYVRQIIINAIYSVVFFAVSNFFLKRRLNLE